MTENAITMRGVNKYYGGFHALVDVDLTVRRGERIVICGPSGSGKSTLIRTINQLEPIESGSIVVDGVELKAGGDNVAKIRRDVGMVFQSFNLFPHMTAVENVMEGMVTVLRTPKAAARTPPSATSALRWRSTSNMRVPWPSWSRVFTASST